MLPPAEEARSGRPKPKQNTGTGTSLALHSEVNARPFRHGRRPRAIQSDTIRCGRDQMVGAPLPTMIN